MASPRGSDEASAFDTDEDTRAETPDTETDFVSTTDFKSPRGGHACGVADLSSDGEDEHADVGVDDARAFGRAHRRGRASSFRGVGAESRDDSSEGGRSSSESTVRFDATGADDADDAPRRPPRSPRVIPPDDLDQDMLRYVMRLTAGGGADADAEDDAFVFSGNEDLDDFGDFGDVGGWRRRFQIDDLRSRASFDEEATTPLDLLDTSPHDLDLFRETARRDGDDLSSWFANAANAADAANAAYATQSLKSVSEDDEPDDARGDAFFAALLELWFNWNSTDKTRFLRDSGVLDARGRDRFGDYLDRHLDWLWLVSERDDVTSSEATSRVVDAFVRVFGKTPKTERDFRLCLTRCAARDIKTGEVTKFVYPGETIGAPPFEVFDLATQQVVANQEENRSEDASESFDAARFPSAYRGERPMIQKCPYFDAQGWCPDGTRCRWKSAHVARRRPSRRSDARQSLREYWDKLDDPNASPDAARDGYPYKSFRMLSKLGTSDWSRDGSRATHESLSARFTHDSRDYLTFERLRSIQTRASDENDGENEPVWSSPARRKSGGEASTRE